MQVAIVNSFLNVICCNVLASQMTNQMMRIRVIGFTGSLYLLEYKTSTPYVQSMLRGNKAMQI